MHQHYLQARTEHSEVRLKVSKTNFKLRSVSPESDYTSPYENEAMSAPITITDHE